MQIAHFGELAGGTLLPPQVLPPHKMGYRLVNGAKPQGVNVLWGSPVESTDSWLHWSTRQGGDPEAVAWIVELGDRMKVLKVDTPSDVRSFMARFGEPDTFDEEVAIDWVDIKHRYDAVWLTHRARIGARAQFVSWDCESVVVFNIRHARVLGKMFITV